MLNSLPAIHDISRPIDPALPVWPGDPPFELEWMSRRADGDIVNVAMIRMGVHTGTHADAPRHIRDNGPSIDELGLTPFVGRALLVDARDQGALDISFVTEVLARTLAARRILFRTGAWATTDGFPEDFPTLDPGAVELMIAAGVVLVGTDAPSVDPLDSVDLPAHHALLAAGIPILENLSLEDPPPGEYELIALPLPIVGADASPVRAILRAL